MNTANSKTAYYGNTTYIQQSSAAAFQQAVLTTTINVMNLSLWHVSYAHLC